MGRSTDGYDDNKGENAFSERGGGGRNREKILRGEEDLSKGPRIPMLLGSVPEIQATRIILTAISADPDAAGADRSANVLDEGDGSSPSSLDPASDAYGGDDIG